MLRTVISSAMSRRCAVAVILSLAGIAGHGNPKPQDGPSLPNSRAVRSRFAMHTVKPAYRQQDGTAFALTPGTRALSLTTADFNHDGYPDLAVGYATSSGGLLAIHLANREAFSPRSPESLQSVAKGQFPASFLGTATVIHTMAPPDFLAAGDFDGHGHTGILFAAKGDTAIHVLKSVGDGSLGSEQQIRLPGNIVTLAAWGLSPAASQAEVVVAVEGEAGSSLLIYRPTDIAAGLPAKVRMPAPVTSLAIGNLDDDQYPDVAVAAGGRLYILHGGEATSMEQEVRLEGVPTAQGLQTLTAGRFHSSGKSSVEIAYLAYDGVVHIIGRGGTSAVGFAAPASRRGKRQISTAMWRPGQSQQWTETQAVSFGSGQQRGKLFAGRMSGISSDDLLVVDERGGRAAVFNAAGSGPTAQRPSGIRHMATLDSAPVAVLSMRLNAMGSSGLVMLTPDDPAPRTDPPQPNVTFNVTALGDSTTGTCTTPSGDPLTSSCTTLRAAVIASNSYYGENLIAFSLNGTVTLSVAGDDDDAQAGDLDVTNALTIVGNGASNTIIQGGSSNSTGIDKVFSFNPLGQLPGFAVSLSGLTIRFGANTSTDFSIGNNEGGALDFDASLEDGAGSLTIADCSILQNSTVNGDGGGIAVFDGGTVSITGTNISGNQENEQASTAFYGGGIFVGNADPFPVSITITNSTITNNTATSGGGALYAYGPGTTIAGSRIVGNTSIQGASALGGYGAAGATVAATQNWWGSNDSPAGLNSGIASFDPWLVLTLAASATTLNAGDDSTVTAGIDSASDSSGGFTVADGTPVNFSGTLGTVTPAATTMSDGSAASTYTAGSSGGSGSVTATVDNQTISIPLSVVGASVTAVPAVTSFSGGGIFGTIDSTNLTLGWSFTANSNLTVTALAACGNSRETM